MIKRIDPETCGCTDCISGYSKPLEQAGDSELIWMFTGAIDNATGLEFDVVARLGHREVEIPASVVPEGKR